VVIFETADVHLIKTILEPPMYAELPPMDLALGLF